MYTVGVCIVNYKTPHLVEECLEGLKQLRGDSTSLTVAVVDNASGDDSVLRLSQFVEQQQWGDWIDVIDGEINGGFSYGNNIAIEHLQKKISPDYFWLVNPDTLPRPDSLSILMRALNDDPKAGIAGSGLEDEDGTGQISAFNFPKPFGDFVNMLGMGFIERIFPSYVVAQELHEGDAQSVDWVAGASMLIKKDVVERIGLMDDNYFLYFEEVDYCLMAYRAGFIHYVVPQSRVLHHVGASTGISDSRKQAPRRPRYWFESRKRFIHKNYGVASLLLADTLWILAYALNRIKHRLAGKPSLDPPHFFKDFFMNSVFVSGFNSKPRHLAKNSTP